MTVPENSEPRGVILPADYYSAPAAVPILPRWASYGCGGASVVFLIALFAGGAYLSAGGFTRFMDFVLGMSIGEMRGMYGSNVTEAQKQSLEAEIDRMRDSLRAERVAVGQMQPFLQTMQKAMNDGKVTAEESALLEETTRNINQRAAVDRDR